MLSQIHGWVRHGHWVVDYQANAVREAPWCSQNLSCITAITVWRGQINYVMYSLQCARAINCGLTKVLQPWVCLVEQRETYLKGDAIARCWERTCLPVQVTRY